MIRPHAPPSETEEIKPQDSGHLVRAPDPRSKEAEVIKNMGFEGKIGLAQLDITPAVGIRIKNWGASSVDLAQGVHMPLMAYAVTFQKKVGDVPMVLLSLDLGWWRTVEHEWSVRKQVLAELGLPESHLMIHLTHTHAGPSLNPDEFAEPGGLAVAKYLQDLPQLLVQVAKAAIKRAEWGILEWVVGSCRLAWNRDIYDQLSQRYLVGVNTNAHVKRDVMVGRISGLDCAVRGTLVNYACHPTSLGWDNHLLSPDYPGTARQIVEQATGAPCIFLQGLSGEIGPLRGFSGDVKVAESNGRQLGHAVLSVLSGFIEPGHMLLRTGVVESGAPIERIEQVPASLDDRLNAQIVEVPLVLKDLGHTADELMDLSRHTDDPAERERLVRRAQIRANFSGPTHNTKVWLWRVGSTRLLGLPGEAYSTLLDEIRGSPEVPLVGMNVVNGWLGYFPPKDAYGRDMYSVNQTPFENGCLENIARQVTLALAKS